MRLPKLTKVVLDALLTERTEEVEVLQRKLATLRAEVERLTRERDAVKAASIRASSACDDAIDDIAAVCGCPEWEYAGQVVRDVQALRATAWPGEGEEWTMEPVEVAGVYCVGMVGVEGGHTAYLQVGATPPGHYTHRWPRPLPTMPPVPEVER